MQPHRVAFVCTHNSCRSQMAEAFARQLAADVVEPLSAGTNPGGRIDPGAVRLLRTRYGIDMPAEGQRPKALGELPPVEGVVTMGCGVSCPALPCRWREDWGLSDPTGGSDEAYLAVAEEIRANVLALAERLRVARG